MSLRMQRVSELVKREVGGIIQRNVVIPNTLVSVVDAEVASDLKTAKIYISVIGTAETKQKALKTVLNQKEEIREELGRSIVLKYLPHLNFILDESIARGDRVLKILDELEQQQAKP